MRELLNECWNEIKNPSPRDPDDPFSGADRLFGHGTGRH